MSPSRIVGIACAAGMVAMAILFLPKMAAPDSALSREVLTPELTLAVAAPSKLAFLLLGAVFASRCYRSFEAANPIRSAWLGLAVGLWSYVAAQSVLVCYQLVLNTPAPFPSLADVFFVPATFFLAASLYRFLLVYRSVGLDVAGPREVTVTAGATFLLLVAFLATVGAPVLASETPVVERALNLAYPLLDLFLLAPAAMLLKMAFGMRGGRLWRVWMGLLLGFVFLAAGDILFAFFTTFGRTELDPLLDLMFAWSYMLIASAVASQYDLLSSPSPVD